MWPRRSNSCRVSCSASLLLRDDWQLSCLHHCRLIFVRSHLFDRGSEGLLSQETAAYCMTASARLRGFTCSGATPVISLRRWNYVCINLHYILSYHNISFFIIIMHCTLLYHLITLLLLRKQCSMNTQLDLQWWLLTWTTLFCEEDNIHTCNLFLHQAVVWFLMTHTL